MRKQGDISRKRRLNGSPGKQAWYAQSRQIRFARRLGFIDQCAAARHLMRARQAAFNGR